MTAAQQSPVEVIVNGAKVSTGAATLADLLEQQGHGTARVATAVNGTFIAARARAAYRLHPGDRIEIVSARQGG